MGQKLRPLGRSEVSESASVILGIFKTDHVFVVSLSLVVTGFPRLKRPEQVHLVVALVARYDSFELHYFCHGYHQGEISFSGPFQDPVVCRDNLWRLLKICWYDLKAKRGSIELLSLSICLHQKKRQWYDEYRASLQNGAPPLPEASRTRPYIGVTLKQTR